MFIISLDVDDYRCSVEQGEGDSPITGLLSRLSVSLCRHILYRTCSDASWLPTSTLFLAFLSGLNEGKTQSMNKGLEEYTHTYIKMYIYIYCNGRHMLVRQEKGIQYTNTKGGRTFSGLLSRALTIKTTVQFHA